MAREEEFQRMVAFLFQRSGRRSLSENELANAVSLDLKWYNPKVARGLVAGLVRAGWLVRDEEGELEPSFDVKEIKIPIGFRPPAELADEVPPPGSYSPAPTTPSSPEPHKPPTPASSPPPPAASADPPAQVVESPQQQAPAASPAGTESEPPSTTLGEILARLADASGEDAAAWVTRMDAVVQKTDDGLSPEVALLLAAAKAGVDVAPWLEAARQRLV